MDAEDEARLSEAHRHKQFRAISLGFVCANAIVLLTAWMPKQLEAPKHHGTGMQIIHVSQGCGLLIYFTCICIKDDKAAHLVMVTLKELNAYVTTASMAYVHSYVERYQVKRIFLAFQRLPHYPVSRLHPNLGSRCCDR